MPTPTAALQRPELGATFEEFDLEAHMLGFIGTRALPIFNTAKQTANFGVIPVEALLKTGETRRASGGSYARGDWEFETQNFATEEQGQEEPVDDRDSEIYKNYFTAELIAAKRARHAIMMTHEKNVAAAVFNATTWTATSVTNEWDDHANATPIDDVLTAILAIRDGVGLKANTLIVDLSTWLHLKNVAQIVDRVKYAGFDDPKNITLAAVAQALAVDQILVAGAVKDTAQQGAAVSISQVWSNEYAMVAALPVTDDLAEPGLGRTFLWGGDGGSEDGTMESYRDESRRSTIIRARFDLIEKIIYVGAGHLLDNITT